MNLEALRQKLSASEPAALLVEPRILRRVIRLDRRLPGLGFLVPHRKCYTIERDRLLAFVDRSELELPPAADLPPVVLLLAKPEDEETPGIASEARLLDRYGRLLFHSCVHAEMDKQIALEQSPVNLAAERRGQMGDIEFAELRTVLLKDEMLFPTPTDLEVYIEFVAVYLELSYFAPHELPLYFPAIRDWSEIDRIVSADIDHAQLYQRLNWVDAREQAEAGETTQELDADKAAFFPVQPFFSLVEFRRLQTRAEKAAALGNAIKSAILHTRAALSAPRAHATEAHAAARAELTRFVRRLQHAQQFSDEDADQWCAALEPLLAPAADGFWSSEARLLYDLQKVCIEEERGVYRLDLPAWIRTLGKVPLRRPLPLLQDALVIRHLRTAKSRLAVARISHEARQRLENLLEGVVPRIEAASRDRIRPRIVEVLDEVGLVPQNTPERVAREKVVEELLDRIVEHSYLNMGDLRDSLSKNDLKLPDVSNVVDLARGDRLLRADKKLDAALDGVYRRGAFYLRWSQTLSSLAFGTSFGRFLTQYVAIPFGGAYLALEFIRHITLWIQGKGHDPELYEVLSDGTLAVRAVPEHPTHDDPTWRFYASVLLLGIWLWLLIHRPAFRAWTIATLGRCWQFIRHAAYDLPVRVLKSRVVQQILNSQAYAAVQSYVLTPAAITAVMWLALRPLGYLTGIQSVINVYLLLTLLLNSPVGRYIREVTSDFLVRMWHELRMRVFAAVFQWIMEFFNGLAAALERLVYSVDEWLRFRAGDTLASRFVKLVSGAVWFFVAYVVMFAFTVLIEPQINPIKHFPVVTVSHKMLLPLAFTKEPTKTPSVFGGVLSTGLGLDVAEANFWAVWILTAIPGVFGFLVWELKENWRLYAANRAPALRPVPIGHHGETMVRLLRPGFHSGALPKAFATLRRALRKVDGASEPRRLTRRRAALLQITEAVRRFVERELVHLIDDAGVLPGVNIQVGEVRTATNRIDVELQRADLPQAPAILTWEEEAGTLRGQISQLGWIGALTPDSRQLLSLALAGVFQRAGVEKTDGPIAVPIAPAITWDQWVARWPEQPAQGVDRAIRAG